MSRLSLLLAVLAVGCTSSSPTLTGAPTTIDAGCRNDPDVGFRVFPAAAATADVPECSPACNPVQAPAGAGLAPLDQFLPAGPCEVEGASCRSGRTAGSCGPCRTTGGPGSEYLCTCRRHRWQCAIVARGLTVCDGPTCLGVSRECRSFDRTATEICACGTCRKLCTSNAECPSGTTCRVGELCFPSGACPGPDECTADCTGFCL